VRERCRSSGLAVLWATHLMDEVEPGDTVIALHEGRVRAQTGAGGLRGVA
jgi:ABC-2 type transport system ATP-binding protein